MNYYFWALLTVFTLISTSVNGLSIVNVEFGSKTDGTNGSIFTNQDGTGFNSSSTGVLAVGWSDAFSASLSLNDYLANFNILAWTNFNNVAAPGYLAATDNFDNDIEGAAGKTGYLMVLAGITDFSNSSDATEFAIIGNSSWEVVPSGGDFTPDSWNLTSLNNVDNILYGTQTPSGGIGSGNAFGTLAVPEPSNYASIIGFVSLTLALLRRRGVMVKNL